MAYACGGRGGRACSPPRLINCLVCFLCVAVCRAQLQPPSPQKRLQVKTYRFQPSDSAPAGTLQQLKYAGINGGLLLLPPDTHNNDPFPVNKSGSILLHQPFTLWSPLDDESTTRAAAASGGSNGNGSGQAQRVRVVSFNSTFSMNIFYDGALPGEGITFLIAPSLDGPPPGSDGGYLGLTNATLEENPAKNKFVAIEFDTFKQSYDPNNNHIGLDIGTVVWSNKTANLSDFNITIATNRTTAAVYTVWIKYDGVARHISVYMSLVGKPKPASPVLDAPLDLSKHVPETSYLGFSASTGATFELNSILDWTLTIEIFPEKKKSKMWKILIVVFVPATVAFAITIATFFLTRMLRARLSMKRRQERLEHTLSNLPGMPREFAYKKLRKATKDFDERLRLGKGGYGIVYKGLLPAEDSRPEAMEVAVKRFIRDDAKCVDDFVMEVDIINRLRHKNIVPLIGWCYKKGQLLLVYEYMPNASLDQHLFRSGVHEQRPVLSWESRYGIVADVASGLHYVHHEYGRMVLHRDIKASNVLLDASFRARLGDFGLARVIEFDRNSFTDIGVAGTRGYIAPEYCVGHKVTRQTDVFAFGALVLEAVTGRCALLGDPSCPLLSDWVWRLHGRGALLGAVDQNLGTDGFDADEASRLLLLGLACSSPNPGDRPTMPHVLQIVSKSAPPPEVPQFKPTFVWPPEGGTHFDLSRLSDIEVTSGSYAGTGNGTSAHATEACAGQAAGQGKEGCRVAWDEVEEVSQAKADLRRRIAEGADDPLEPFCSHNPLADDCAVVYDDD